MAGCDWFPHRRVTSIIFALALGSVAAFAPDGFAIALVAGMLMHRLRQWRQCDV
jgi:hypothetical protein